MATHDYVIDNSTGANVRADINLVLQAILTNNSSSSAPSTTAAYMWWADTTNGVLKIRNSSNNDWVELLQLDGTITLEDGSAATPGLAFRDDLDTGIFSGGANQFQITTGGAQRLKLDGTEVVFNDNGVDTDLRIEGSSQANLFHINAGDNSIGIRTATPDRLLTINASATTRMNIKSGSSSTAGIEFGDSDDFNAGFIVYDNSDNSLGFGVNGAGEKVRIASNGGLCVNSTSADNNVHIGITSSSTGIILKAAGDHHSLFDANSNRASAGNTLHRYLGRWNGTQVAQMAFVTGSDTTNKDDGVITFSTSSADNLTERFRIDSSGRIIQRYSAAPYDDRALTLQSPSGQTTTALAIVNTETNGQSNIVFGDHVGQNAGNFTGFISYSHQTDAMVFGTNGGNERMRLTADGPHLLLGGSSDVNEITESSANAGMVIGGTGFGNGGLAIINSTSGTGRIYFGDAVGSDAGRNRGQINYGHSDDHMRFVTAASERMRIESNGDFEFDGIGTATPGNGNNTTGMGFEPRNGTIFLSRGDSAPLFTNTNTTDVDIVKFSREGTLRGRVFMQTTTVSYATSSDYRLKENAVAISDGITRLKSLKPYRFNFIEEPSKTVDGFFAHEVTAVPEAVSGTKDAVDSDGNIEPQGLDYGRITPLLTAALQEAIAKIEVLETKVAALEAA